jgi:hypothetical protein
LSYNRISVIEGLDQLPIKELRLKNNNITMLSGLDNLPVLSYLDVSENSIVSLAPLVSCANLTFLDVSNNQIEYIRQVEFIKDVPWLTTLNMFNNPCYQKELYRLRVLVRLPRLQLLDNENATSEEKVR